MRTSKTRLMIAVLLGGFLAGFAPIHSNGANVQCQPEHMYPSDIAFQNEVYLICDISGSARKYEDRIYDMMVICDDILTSGKPQIKLRKYKFSTSLEEMASEEEFRATGDETDLYTALEQIDSQIKNGKRRTSVILFTDYYDTWMKGSIMDPDRDREQIEGRSGAIKKILDNWRNLRGVDTYISYTWESESDQDSGLKKVWVENGENTHDLQRSDDILELKRECVPEMVKLCTDTQDLKWEAFDGIALEQEEEYRNYYIFSEKPLGEDCTAQIGKEENLTRVGERCRLNGYIYRADELPLSKLDLHDEANQIFILNIPYVQVELYINSQKYWATLYNNTNLQVDMKLVLGGKEIRNPDLVFFVEYGLADQKSGMKRESLKFKEKDMCYRATLRPLSPGVYQICAKVERSGKCIYMISPVRIYQRLELTKENRERLEKKLSEMFDNPGQAVQVDLRDYLDTTESQEYLTRIEAPEGFEVKQIAEGRPLCYDFVCMEPDQKVGSFSLKYSVGIDEVWSLEQSFNFEARPRK